MNLLLLETADFVGVRRVRLAGRRLKHVREVHGAVRGETLRVGVVGGRIGQGTIERIDDDVLDMTVSLDSEPPQPIPLRLVLALPRPKVLNRVVAAAASMGIREIDLINSWRVDKFYWSSPLVSEQNLRMQSILGLEQAGDTILPTIRLRRLFAPFVRQELPAVIDGRFALLAHPKSGVTAPRNVAGPVVLAIGPEGGFIEREVNTFLDIGFSSVNLGPRILRVETALACLIGRLF